MALSFKPVYRNRAFVSGKYYPDDRRSFRSEMPKKCPLAEVGNDSCKLYVERWRARKHGPGFKLLVSYCVNHKVSFTIYPYGWASYGRKPIDKLDMRGNFVVQKPRDPMKRWEETEFCAVYDAANGTLWSSEGPLGPETNDNNEPTKPSFRTQLRAVVGAIRLLGLDPDLSDKERERASRTLGIDLFVLTSGSQSVRDGPSIIEWAMEGAKVLAKLPAIFSTVSGLLDLFQIKNCHWL